MSGTRNIFCWNCSLSKIELKHGYRLCCNDWTRVGSKHWRYRSITANILQVSHVHVLYPRKAFSDNGNVTCGTKPLSARRVIKCIFLHSLLRWVAWLFRSWLFHSFLRDSAPDYRTRKADVLHSGKAKLCLCLCLFLHLASNKGLHSVITSLAHWESNSNSTCSEAKWKIDWHPLFYTLPSHLISVERVLKWSGLSKRQMFYSESTM